MRMGALIKANLGENPEKIDNLHFAQAYCQAVWLEQFRLRNQAELLAAMFGGKKGKD